MSYTQVFGGTTIYPSDVSYLAITLSADKALEWPLESNDPANPASRIIDVTTDGSGYSIVLPDATLTGAGQTILFNNLSASTDSFLVKDYAGGTIATVGVGEQWQVYLAATSTAAGTWRVFRYGASTATVQPSALAGYGLAVTSNTLSQSLPVTTFNTSPRTALVTDRASALVWTGTGSGTLNLPSTVTAGNNFFIAVRNSGGGDLTVDAAGSETIDGTATLALRPGDSTQLITDGLAWYTLGLGQEAVFAFDYTSISVTGGTYTLAGSELNRIAYEFVGNLASDLYVVVPSTIQQYWVSNATTGPYALYLQTSGGTPVGVGQGTRGIYYCNGSNVVDADTATISLPVSPADGGTGITNYTTGDLLYASGAQTLSRLADVAVGNVLLSGGVTVAPSWGKVGLTTHVSGQLPVANGGTGQSSFTDGQLLIGNSTGNTLSKSTLTAGSGVSITNGGGSITISATGSGGTVTSVGGTGTVNGITLTGTVTSSGNLTLGGTLSGVSLTSQVTGTLPYGNGGTGLSATPSNGQLLIGNGSGYTLANLTAGSGVSITNSAGGITIAATSTGLTNWTEAANTSSPNATVPVVSFTATNAATNVDAAIVPKGTGAVLAAVPDNATAGGNKRGTNAVDLQTDRTSSNQVASGASSGVLSGGSNRASGTNNVVAGGSGNTASGSSYATVSGGLNNTADGYASAVTGGAYGTARGATSSVFGAWAITNTAGVSQMRRFVLGRQTTDATSTVLAATTSAPSSSNQVNLANSSALYFKGAVIANVANGGNTKGWTIEGVIKRAGSASTTALVGTPTVTSNYADAGASGWAVSVTADTTNGCLAITVTGQASTTIRWVASIETTEVTF